MKNKKIIFGWQGISFIYHGDDILYIWPWRRLDGGKFISFGCCGVFNNLKDIDKFWEEYFRSESDYFNNNSVNNSSFFE